jgi:hypothetical protein
MSIDLTPATAAEMTVNRLLLADDAEVVFEDADADLGYVEKFSLGSESGDWDAQQIINTQNNQEYLIVRVLDYEGFEDLLNTVNTIKFEGYHYKIDRTYVPHGATRLWTFRCERVERASS